MAIFLLIGVAIDGAKLAAGNLILIIAPEEKRPVYIAIASNITSLGLFFAICGGVVLSMSNYTILYSLTIFLLSISLFSSYFLKDK
jgi:hypothetical protein